MNKYMGQKVDEKLKEMHDLLVFLDGVEEWCDKDTNAEKLLMIKTGLEPMWQYLWSIYEYNKDRK